MVVRKRHRNLKRKRPQRSNNYDEEEDGDFNPYDNDNFEDDPFEKLEQQMALLDLTHNKAELNELERALKGMSLTDASGRNFSRKIAADDEDYKLIERTGPDAEEGERWLKNINRNVLVGKVRGVDDVGNYQYDAATAELFPWSRRMLEFSEYSRYRSAHIRDAPAAEEASERLNLFYNTKTYGVDTAPGLAVRDRLAVYFSCVDLHGRTATLKVRGFQPYLYVKIPQNWPGANNASSRQCHITAFRQRLNSALRKEFRGSFYIRNRMGDALAREYRNHPLVVDVTLIERAKDLYICEGKSHYDSFLKITLPHPVLVPQVKDLLKNPSGGYDSRNRAIPAWYVDPTSVVDTQNPNLRYPNNGASPGERFQIADHYRGFQVYEANVDFANRLAIDRDITASTWLCVDPGRYRVVPEEQRFSISDLEYEVHWTDLREAAEDEKTPDGRSLREVFPELLVMAFDIEAEPDAEGAFPGPVNDRVLQIACHGYNVASRKHERFMFMLGDYDPTLLDATGRRELGKVFWFKTEERMLASFVTFLQVMQPQFLMGWNSNGFDLPYLFNRCRVLGVSLMANLGSMPGRRVSWALSRNKGREKTNVSIPGTVAYDLMYHIMGMKRFKSGSLSNACSELLKINKLEQSYQVIRKYQTTTEGRTRLAVYCARDVEVLIKILVKMKTIFNLVEESRTTNTTMADLLDRGSQYKIFMTTLTRARLYCQNLFGARGFYPTLAIVPKAEKYTGGAVLPPIKGFYNKSIVFVLDLMSLYPSIMMEFNLCPSTALTEETIEREGLVENIDYKRAPVFTVDSLTAKPEEGNNNHNTAFATQEYQPGLTPMIEAELFAERRAVKKLMAAALEEVERIKELLKEDSGNVTLREELSEAEFQHSWLDAKQNAQKTVMNSMYGTKGSCSAKDRMVVMAMAICDFGRYIIAQSSWWMKANLTRAAGFPMDVEPIYGDTDSVFGELRFPNKRVYDPSTGRYGEVEVPIQEQATIAMQYGPEFARRINAFYRNTLGYKNGRIIQEFEKIYYHLIMVTKKTYCGMLMNLEGEKYIDIKGLKAKRRDCSGFLLRVQRGVIERLTEFGDANGALEIAKAAVDDLVHHRISYEELRESKSISKYPEEYKVLTPHVAVALENQKRSGRRARPGDRVNYVITKSLAFTPGRKTYVRKRDVATDAAYAIEHEIDYDEQHYVTNVLFPNVANLLQHVVKGGMVALKRMLLNFSGRAGGVTRAREMALTERLEALRARVSSLEEAEVGDGKRQKIDQIKGEISRQTHGTLDAFVRRTNTVRCRGVGCRIILSQEDLEKTGSLGFVRDAEREGRRVSAYCYTCARRGVASNDHAAIEAEKLEKQACYEEVKKICTVCSKQAGSRSELEIEETIKKCNAQDCTYFWKRLESGTRIRKLAAMAAQFAPALLL